MKILRYELKADNHGGVVVPTGTCDCCGKGIKNAWLVSDGARRFWMGSACVERAVNPDSVKAVRKALKNVKSTGEKRAAHYAKYAAKIQILSENLAAVGVEHSEEAARKFYAFGARQFTAAHIAEALQAAGVELPRSKWGGIDYPSLYEYTKRG